MPGRVVVVVALSAVWCALTACGAIVPTPPTTPTAGTIISRARPVYASSGTASAATDADYGNEWRSSGAMPQWLAVDLSAVPDAQRQRVLLWWSSAGTYNYDGVLTGEPGYNVPMDYTIQTHTQPGGMPPATGWATIKQITGEKFHSRQLLLDLAGVRWVRLHVTGIYGSTQNMDASLNLDVFDASGATDSWIVYGDSIPAAGLRNSPVGTTGTFGELIAEGRGRHPAFEQGAWGGTNTWTGVEHIERWLGVFPGKYVILAWGTNDANGQSTPDQYKANTLTLVDRVLAAGKTPVLGTIPWARVAQIQTNAPLMNAKIAEIYAERPAVVRGPDLYTFFQNNQHLISSDNVHPTADGYAAYRRQWTDQMLRVVYTTAGGPAMPTLTAITSPVPTTATPVPSSTTTVGAPTPRTVAG